MFNEPNIQGGIVNTIFALLFAINLVAIIWGIVMYYVEFGSDHGKHEGKEWIILTVTLLFLLMCLYAIVEWVRSTVGF